ncbi:phosphopentomutase [Ancylomarina euxinus]|uniref:Phosphopentomutase n=1 Tax=Ancylomarina euxinus TaxID=2283627 RepID=A0A425Y2Y5_9BACT|nr:phosphopentomutase [Ancylomarina euxinus]MCZ4694938.1 phosphopentomutase [Ancylomarina euxinus]MUP14804.1 phosphopentomutase [Ancylomarina euxinus]RRG22148.1 phosphopentomutase [Ancylomarina euxinus]
MIPKIERATIVVLDSAGVGALPDAADFGDVGSNTFGNIASHCGGINLPNMQKLGLGNLTDIQGVEPTNNANGAYGKAAEASKGKDTTTGHWEIAGVAIDKPFPTYSNGFSDEVIRLFEERTGRKVMANKPASGTAILDEYGEEHMKTGNWILYTSADPVFQVAAHEEIVPLEELYKACEIALEICTELAPVARVIARPFIGSGEGKFTRTAHRHDFSVTPPRPTLLDRLLQNKLDVIGIGKTSDIFAGQGISDSRGTNKDNNDGVAKTLKALEEDTKGLIFTNLVDFDMAYGHRRNPEGYKAALEEFDQQLPEIQSRLKEDEILILTADHGCDPTYKGTDHTREYIPVLVYGKNIKTNINLGTRTTFADIASTVEELLLGTQSEGSFAKDLYL